MSDTTVHVEHVEAFLESFGEVSPVFQRKASNHFEEHGIDPYGDQEWVRQESVRSAVAALAEDAGSATMYEAGKSVGGNIPTEASEPTALLQTLNETHKAAFRDPRESLPAGEFQWSETGGSLRVSATQNWPYGDSFPHGSEFTSGILSAVLSTTTSSEITEISADSREAIAFEVDL